MAFTTNFYSKPVIETVEVLQRCYRKPSLINDSVEEYERLMIQKIARKREVKVKITTPMFRFHRIQLLIESSKESIPVWIVYSPRGVNRSLK